MDALARYRALRNFSSTPEPEGGTPAGTALRYAVQCHDATRLHWDLRLEWQGALLSWAVTRGPSTDPADKRLAVRTEAHPLDYLTFEGTIPEGNYGAGTVMLWDIGWWQPYHGVDAGLSEGHLHFALHGRRATGAWSLVRLKRDRDGGQRENWLLIKDKDDASAPGRVPFAERYRTSVASGRTLREIAGNAPARPPGTNRKDAAPAFRPVQLAETVDAPPDGPNWVHEVKLDGYRAQIAIGRQGVRIRTRSGADWTERFAELVPALAELPCDTALIDGEVMVGAGLFGFADLQAAIKTGGPFRYYAFDLLHRDGADLAARPLTERRAALSDLIRAQPPRGMLQLSPLVDGAADAALEAVCGAGGEGLVSKLADAPYRSGRSSAWVKSKCSRREEFVIVGWQPSARPGRPFASLLLASHSKGRLTYRGKVGTGWDHRDMDEIAALLEPLSRQRAPVAAPDGLPPGIRWVEPQLVAEVAFAERTRTNLLRHARFVALRQDKSATEVEEEPVTPSPTHDTARIQLAGVGISSPERVVFPEVRLTKLALAEYYLDMADRILPALERRPLSLLRVPDGITGQRFFQKHAGDGFPEAIRRVTIAEPDGTTDDCMALDKPAGLVAAVQMGAVEFHSWGARIDKPDRPDRLVFDLDPDDAIGFAEVKSAAITLRDRLSDLGLPSWAMVSGGKGLHLVTPLRRSVTWDTVKLFSQLFAKLLSDAEPERFAATLSKRARTGRIFIDWMRNERGATAVAPFTVRARPKAPVAVPIAWNELDTIAEAGSFGLAGARERGWGDLAVPEPISLGRGVLDRLAADIGA